VKVRFIEKGLLETYLLHATLFETFTGNSYVEFVLSLLLIIAVSIVLWCISEALKRVASRLPVKGALG